MIGGGSGIDALLGRAQSHFKDRYEGSQWPLGELPTNGDCVLIADGFMTSSVKLPWLRPHWIEFIHPVLEPIEPDVTLRGFSYAASGIHYSPENTKISIVTGLSCDFKSYCPRDPSTVAYGGFSLGAHVIALGLYGHILSRQGNGDAGSTPNIGPITLLQPPLGLADAFKGEALRQGSDNPLAHQLLYNSTDITDNFVAALSKIVACGVNVTLLCWPGDEFAPYGKATLDQLRATGADVQLINPPASRSKNAFIQHAKVAEDPETLRLFCQSLASAWRLSR